METNTKSDPLKCPCGAPGDLVAAPVPTDEQFRRFKDRENPELLPTHADTAPPRQREELGALHYCPTCGYKARIKAAAGADAAVGN